MAQCLGTGRATFMASAHSVFSRRLGVLTLIGIAVSMPNGVQSAPPAKDANALVRQMVARYHAAASVQEEAEATVRVGNNAPYIQTTRVKFARPNRLTLETTDPALGTLRCVSDGRRLNVWVGTQNIYVQRTAAPTIPLTVAALSRATLQMIHLPVTQLLGPLSFLAADSMPVEAHEFRYVGVQNTDGIRTDVVKSPADPGWTRAFLRIASGDVTRREITLWIDASQHTLVRARCEIAWEQRLPATAKRGAGMAKTQVTFDEVHRHCVLGAAIPAGEFAFEPPQGAVEEFPERQ